MMLHVFILSQIFLLAYLSCQIFPSHGALHQILLDSDIDRNDFFAILYLLKQNRSEFNVKVRLFSASLAFTYMSLKLCYVLVWILCAFCFSLIAFI